jgi:hypothetical protein
MAERVHLWLRRPQILARLDVRTTLSKKFNDARRSVRVRD